MNETKTLQGEVSKFFSEVFLKKYIKWEVTHRWKQSLHFFSKTRHFFDLIFTKGIGDLPPPHKQVLSLLIVSEPVIFKGYIPLPCIWYLFFKVWFRCALTPLITLRIFMQYMLSNYRYYHLPIYLLVYISTYNPSIFY